MGRGGAIRGKNVETPHPAERKHAPRVFCFHRTKSFHANDRLGPDSRAVVRRAILKGILPPSSNGIRLSVR
jgi:hypothetical protein